MMAVFFSIAAKGYMPITPLGRPFTGVVLIIAIVLQACTSTQPPSLKPQTLFSGKLDSAISIDYSKLHTLLQQQNWQAADQETLRLLLAIGDRTEAGWLSQQDIEQLPCTDLITLSQLWHHYSSGHFGFIRQQKIWESLGGVPGQYEPQRIEQLGDRLGWRRRNQWLTYEKLNFSATAPEGHLPASTGNGVSGGVWGGVAALSYRVKYCPLIHALEEQRWVHADWETLSLMNDYIEFDEAIPDLPGSLNLSRMACHEMEAIDQLWSKYSNGRFGFKVQTQILQATGNKPDELHWRKYEAFEAAVGWDRMDVREQEYNNTPLNEIPQGHFPYRLGYSYETYGSGFHRTWRLGLKPECGL